MRTLKKTLCLVLALALCFSFASVAFADYSDYTDADQVGAAYEEAVAVLIGTGIVNGMTDTTIAPTGSFTREQAAKIVAYMTLGETVADALKADAAPFTDVAATRWSAGYIAYCVAQGYVKGYGDGKFGPSDELTGLQFAAMLLRVLGFDGEYEGSSWAINTAKDALNNGIFTGDATAASNETVQRQQAMLMAFNAFEYTTAGTATGKYVLTSNKTELNGINGEVFDSRSEAILVATGIDPTAKLGTDYTLTAQTTNTGSLAQKVYGLDNGVVSTDVFGRTTKTFTGNNDVEVVIEATPALQFTGTKTVSAVYNALGLKAASVSATSKTDGKTNENVALAKADTDTLVGAVGATTYIYKTAAGAVSIAVVTDYLAQVTKVVPAKAATDTTVATPASVELSVFAIGDENATVEKLTFATDAFAKDDYVVVNVNKADSNKVITAVAANSVTGIQSAHNAKAVTVSGTAYSLSAQSLVGAKKVDFTQINFADSWTYYLNSDNVVIGAVKAADNTVIPTDYAYVTRYQARAANDGTTNLLGTTTGAATAAAKAELVFTDGKTAVVDLALTTTAGVTSYAQPATAGTVTETTLATTEESVAVGNWFAYTVDANGAYTLSAVDATYAAVAASDVTIAANTPTAISGKYTNSATVITGIKYNETTKVYDVTAITGMPTSEVALGSGKTLYTYAKGSNVVTKVYAFGASVVAKVSEVPTYAYAVEQGNTVANGTEWTFSINGERKTYVMSSVENVEAGKIVVLTEGTGAAAGTYTAAAATGKTEDLVVSMLDTTLFVDGSGTAHNFAATYSVYNIASTAEVKGAADTLEVGDTVTVFKVDSKVVAVFITTEATPAE
jgi:hypothetical protein